VSALSLLDRPFEGSHASHYSSILNSGIQDMPGLIHWLVSRQFIYLDPNAENEEHEDDDVNFMLPRSLSALTLEENQGLVAFNGRCNKTADTCYTWWVGASLASLGRSELISKEASRKFLLEKMQHRIGGFGKKPGSPPDLYHACFGLMILAVLGEEGLNELDSSLAVPVEAVRRMERARKGLLDAYRNNDQAKRLAKDVIEMGLGQRGEKPSWLTSADG